LGREFRWIWLKALAFSLVVTPFLMIWKKEFPWVVSVAIAVGTAAILATDIAIKLTTRRKTELPEQEEGGFPA
jgi:hypothetical protein